MRTSQVGLHLLALAAHSSQIGTREQRGEPPPAVVVAADAVPKAKAAPCMKVRGPGAVVAAVIEAVGGLVVAAARGQEDQTQLEQRRLPHLRTAELAIALATTLPFLRLRR